VSTLLADPSAAAAETQQGLPSGQASNGHAPAGSPQPDPTASPCPNCGAQLAPAQDWCLQCGAGGPGSVERPGWRSAAAIAIATAVLALVAAAAGYAALSHKRPPAPVRTTTVAQATPPAGAPGATPPTTQAPVTPTPTTPPLAPGIATPPKIPLKATTPTVPTTTTPPTPAGEETNNGSKTKSTTPTGGSGSEKTPEPILLDTNAASTYNPYSYPAASFGDPSLAIDGDPSTGWTAQINPATAPKLAQGVLIDLKTPHRLSALKLVTTTPGMTVQVYGANGKAEPSSITDPAWAALSRSVTIHKRHPRLGLRQSKQSYRFVAVWISRAPASSVGTPEAPGRVTVNEIELFPAT
jgi:hypothetical protein